MLVGSLSRAKSNGCCAKADNLLWIRILSRQFVGGDVISIVCQLVPTNAGSNFMGSYFSLCLASSSLFCLSRLLPKQPEDVRSVMSGYKFFFRNAKSCFLDHRFFKIDDVLDSRCENPSSHSVLKFLSKDACETYGMSHGVTYQSKICGMFYHEKAATSIRIQNCFQKLAYCTVHSPTIKGWGLSS